jgi:acetyl esterase/lipase
MRFKIIYMLLALFGTVFSASAQTRVVKNINYAGNNSQENTLNVYYKKSDVKNRDVIIFIHGGSWSSGKKETYWWLGRNFSKKDIVTAIINYPLAPNATYKEMALASAQAVKWVKDSIATYGGNPDRIFIMGHSAGAHLAELINSDPQYFKTVGIQNPIKGVILNDAFGLDMEEYLTKAEKDDYYTDFIRTFSAEAKTWQIGSPLYYVANVSNPHLIFYGTKTYPAIQIQSKRINKELESLNVPVTLQVIEGKKHVAMISQMIFGGNSLYQHISDFIKETK